METFKYQRVVVKCWIFLLVSTLDIISHSFVEGLQKIPDIYKGLKHKGTIKTIVSPEDDVVVDCVDFYKQPAFDDPLIKSLQVDPSLFPGGTKITDVDLYNSGLYQNWRKYGECPNGTIPIRRIHNRNTHRKKRRTSNGNNNNHEYATAETQFGKYHGGTADLNLWKPKTELQELSITQMWLASGDKNMNTIETGWIVYPDRYRNFKPTFFIYWTKDDYDRTGCYDLDCHGFIQTYAGLIIGAPLDPISVYNGTTYDLNVQVYLKQNGRYKNWFLKVNGYVIGYWPGTIFNSLNDGAETVEWGGEIVNRKSQGHHTTTQMGSGHFPYEGYTKASFVSRISVMNSKKEWVSVKETNLQTKTTHPACYDVIVRPPKADLGTHFYYGGPGYSAKCK